MVEPSSATLDDEQVFRSLLARFQAGDRAAGDELWLRYREEIRRSVRARLRHPALRRAVDSLDICQSVARRLCERIEEYPFQTPEEFRRLVAVIVQNRVHEIARRVGRQKELPAKGSIEQIPADADAGTPSEQLIAAEIWNQARALMTAEEWRLVELRILEGRPWRQIAETLGENEDALHKRLTRALARVRTEIDREE